MQIHINSQVITLSTSVLLLLILSKAPAVKPHHDYSSEEEQWPMDPSNATMNPVCRDTLLWDLSQLVKQLHNSSEKFMARLDSFNTRLNYIETFLQQHVKNETINKEINVNPTSSSEGAGISKTELSTFLQHAQLALPMTCEQAIWRAGPNATSGVYQLYLPFGGLEPFFAYCLVPTGNGPAWTIIQRRQDGAIDFNRNWNDYKIGFGNVEGEHWIGLERLFWTTLLDYNKLKIYLEDFENKTQIIYCRSFAIGGEDEFYAIRLLGRCFGEAGDSLRIHQAQKFSTKDADHDSRVNGSCAETFSGGWWFNDCLDSNLNGKYLNGSYGKSEHGKGIVWKTWRGYLYSYKIVYMAIRRTTALKLY